MDPNNEVKNAIETTPLISITPPPPTEATNRGPSPRATLPPPVVAPDIPVVLSPSASASSSSSSSSSNSSSTGTPNGNTTTTPQQADGGSAASASVPAEITEAIGKYATELLNARAGQPITTAYSYGIIVCQIVEKIYNDATPAAAALTLTKQQLALTIASDVLQLLYVRPVPLMSQTVYLEISSIISNAPKFIDLMNGIIEAAKAHNTLQNAEQLCGSHMCRCC
jgi:hypothetical protein